MSRRRKRANGEHEWDWTRFRVVCTCTSPAVVVRRYRALSDPAERRRQLEQAVEPGAFSRMRILSAAESDGPAEYGLDHDPYSGNGARNKPVEWRCPKCHRNLSPTALQADQIADQCLGRGESSIDLMMLSGIVSS